MKCKFGIFSMFSLRNYKRRTREEHIQAVVRTALSPFYTPSQCCDLKAESGFFEQPCACVSRLWDLDVWSVFWSFAGEMKGYVSVWDACQLNKVWYMRDSQAQLLPIIPSGWNTLLSYVDCNRRLWLGSGSVDDLSTVGPQTHINRKCDLVFLFLYFLFSPYEQSENVRRLRLNLLQRAFFLLPVTYPPSLVTVAKLWLDSQRLRGI